MKAKILHINLTDIGGAGRACLNLHKGLLDAGLSSDMLVLEKHRDTDRVHQFDEYRNPTKAGKAFSFFKRHFVPYVNERNLQGRADGHEVFSFAWSLFNIIRHPLYQEADIIHLHFVSEFLDYGSFFTKNSKPLVWTLHDMNPFTGGCHLSLGCDKFTGNCEKCPLLQGTGNPYLSGRIFRKKLSKIDAPNGLTIISPSKWLMEKSLQSRLFGGLGHFHIPHGIDTELFRPLERSYSRELLRLPLDKKIILFLSSQLNRKIKGLDFLLEALKMLPDKQEYLFFPVGQGNIREPDFMETIRHDAVFDDSLLAAVYSAADVTAMPSLQESFSLVTAESMACGTPVIAFDNSGPAEIIVHGETGYLTGPGNIDSFAEGISCLCRKNNDRNIEKKAVARIRDQYGLENQIEKHIGIYEKIIRKLASL